MKKFKKIILGLLAAAFITAGYGFYLFKKKPADIRVSAPQYEMPATALVKEFAADETSATKKYLDKVIAVKGMITGVETDATGMATVFLEGGDPLTSVTCSFYNEEALSAKTLQKGKEVTIKGMCTGKLMDVVLNKCSISK
jgi:hypothetical protein